MSSSNDTQQKIARLQMMEQNMQTFLVQKQQVQSQLAEIDSALKELEKSGNAYKIIGNIMVASNKEELKKDLNQKKETISIRLKSIEKQEESLREKSKSIQSEVLASMKEEESKK